MPLRHRDIPALIADLRSEAARERTSFRKMMLQVLVFAATATGALLVAADRWPISSIAAVGVAAVLVAIQRIGSHVFTTVNRIAGFQLHLERLDESGSDFKVLSTAMGWEEGLRAWRIVQATLFASIYELRFTFWWPWKQYSEKQHYESPWWRQAERVSHAAAIELAEIERGKKGPDVNVPSDNGRATNVRDKKELPRFVGRYHAGSYLSRMFGIMLILQLFSLAPLAAGIFRCRQIALDGSNPPLASAHHYLLPILYGFLAVSCVFCTGNAIWIGRRRMLLEDGLLSIHSCSIVWRAISLIHHAAWLDPDERWQYTTTLTRLTVRFLANDPQGVRQFTDKTCAEVEKLALNLFNRPVLDSSLRQEPNADAGESQPAITPGSAVVLAEVPADQPHRAPETLGSSEKPGRQPRGGARSR